MSNPQIYAGFMGYAVVRPAYSDVNNPILTPDINVRCSEFHVDVSQEVKFYNHIIGLRDSTPATIFDSKGDVGAHNKQNIFYRGGVKLCQGSVSFPMSELGGKAFLNPAIYGDDFNLVLNYYCQRLRTYAFCKVDTYAISATAGDVPTVSVGIKGVSLIEDVMATVHPPYTANERLLTWDDIIITGLAGNILSFDISVNNACKPIYTAAETTIALSPLKLRVGIQQVTGSFTFYSPDGPAAKYIEDITNTSQDISIQFGDLFIIKLKILFPYPEINGGIDKIVHTYKFVGTDIAIDRG